MYLYDRRIFKTIAVIYNILHIDLIVIISEKVKHINYERLYRYYDCGGFV
jgi:hypothetical protein